MAKDERKTATEVRNVKKKKKKDLFWTGGFRKKSGFIWVMFEC